ncbi:MAG: dipeptidase, partial [Novosphingobium sp.]|nr:dipeptidase [Novosphingobium sp.]
MRPGRFGIGWLIASFALALAGNAVAARTPEQVAGAALRAAPVWDGHNDLPIQLRGRYLNVLAGFDLRDTSQSSDAMAHDHRHARPLHTDLARLKRGRVGAQFWSVYVSADLPEASAVQA